MEIPVMQVKDDEQEGEEMGYKKAFRYSTGNAVVDEIGTMNFTGNIIPMVWFKTICYPNGAPRNNAIHILADIVYWYRPKEERDEESGQLIGMKKKFKDDYLQRSCVQMAETFGLSKRQVTETVKALEEMGIIKRIFKTISVRGQTLNNVLFIKLIPKRLYEVTFPEEIEKKALSPPEGSALSIESERGGIPEGQGKHLEVTGHSLQGETNTKNILKITKETTCRDYPSINQGQEGQVDVIDTYTQIVKENIDYDILKADMKYRYDLLDELVDIIVDVVAVDREKIRIGGTDYPYQLVKGKFLKLESGHIRYV